MKALANSPKLARRISQLHGVLAFPLTLKHRLY